MDREGQYRKKVGLPAYGSALLAAIGLSFKGLRMEPPTCWQLGMFPVRQERGPV
jgi:hypothetical protein